MNYIDEIILNYDRDMMLMGDWEIIYKFSRDKKVKVELGTANGLTTILISRGGGKTFTIDRNRDHILEFYLRRYGIESIIGDTVESAKLFKDEFIDFLFIDGGHEYGQVKRDYFAWYPKVKKNSIILFHDMNIHHPGVWLFYRHDIRSEKREGRIRELFQKPQFETITKVFMKL